MVCGGKEELRTKKTNFFLTISNGVWRNWQGKKAEKEERSIESMKEKLGMKIFWPGKQCECYSCEPGISFV